MGFVFIYISSIFKCHGRDFISEIPLSIFEHMKNKKYEGNKSKKVLNYIIYKCFMNWIFFYPQSDDMNSPKLAEDKKYFLG